MTIQVTIHPHNDRARAAAAQFQADDFTVREEQRPQRIISVKSPGEAPPILAALIQDDLVSRVNNEIKGVKEFIRRLPEGSRVMTGYITSGSFRVAQDFTTDLARAADSLRILRSSESAAPFNPYVEMVEHCAASTRNRRGGGWRCWCQTALMSRTGSAAPALSSQLILTGRSARRSGAGSRSSLSTRRQSG